jgi:hypothetical protein
VTERRYDDRELATDGASRRDAATYHNWVLANQRMAAVLKAKRYHYQYVFAREAGHVHGAVVCQTLPQAKQTPGSARGATRTL